MLTYAVAPSQLLAFDSVPIDEDTLFTDDKEEIDRVYKELKERATRQQSLKKNEQMLRSSMAQPVSQILTTEGG